jgi:hypothetical protein
LKPRRYGAGVVAPPSFGTAANSGGLFVFVWFSDNRRLAVFVLLVVVFLFVIIAIVWVSRRHIADRDSTK